MTGCSWCAVKICSRFLILPSCSSEEKAARCLREQGADFTAKRSQKSLQIGPCGHFTVQWTSSTTVFQAIEKITVQAWTERGEPSTRHSRTVCRGAVKKGMEQLESTSRGRAGSKITHEGKDCFALSLNMVCHPLRIRRTDMAAIISFLSSVQ